MKSLGVFEWIYLFASIISGCVVVLNMIFGWMPELDEHIPKIILMLVIFSVIYPIAERRIRIDAIEQKMNKLIKIISDDNLSKLHQINNDIPDTLGFVFKDFIKSYVDFFENAIKKEKIEFYDIERFKTAYIKTLKYKQDNQTAFLATSLPYQRYFWVSNEDLTPILKALKSFTQNGGTFRRIFFIDEGDMEKQEVLSILNKQIELGMEVHTVSIDKVPRRLQKYFVVDDEASLAWEASIDTRQRINSMSFTTSRDETEMYRVIFHELMNLDSLKRYDSLKQESGVPPQK